MHRLLLVLLLINVNTILTSNQALGQSPPAQPAPMLFSRLTINQTHIAFSYAGDIWIVERIGGKAKRLTTHPAEENFPAFSPDGTQLAFSRQVGGNWDVYVMPVDSRVTRSRRQEQAAGAGGRRQEQEAGAGGRRQGQEAGAGAGGRSSRQEQEQGQEAGAGGRRQEQEAGNEQEAGAGGRNRGPSENDGDRMQSTSSTESSAEARRLTYDPRGDFVNGWSPDGKSVLFESNRNMVPHLYTIQLDAMMPKALPLPKAFQGSLSPDGTRVAYTPMGGVGDWRFYRGGSKGQIWLANLSDGVVEKVPSGNFNNDQPRWIGDKIYYISDRNGAYNLQVYDLATKQSKQLTNYTQHGIRWTAGGGGAVAFVRDGRIHLHDPATNQTRLLDVRVNADAPQLNERTASAARTIQSASLSLAADKVAFGARGEVFLFDPNTGDAKNLTQTSGVAERYPVLSPDGKLIAYFSDESGEYELHVRPINADGAVKKIAVEKQPTFYRELTWSADSKRLAFTDKKLSLWIADPEQGTTRRIDSSTYSHQEQWFPNWSPDGRWLTYSKHHRNRVRTVYIYDTVENRTHQITDGRTHAESPVFDRNGKYIHFVSSPNAGTSEFGWGVLNGIMARALVTRRVQVLMLQEGQPVPSLPNGPNPEAKVETITTPVRIDFENIGQRIIEMPIPAGDYAQLRSGKPGVFYVIAYEWPKSPTLGAQPSLTLYMCDLSKPPKLEKLIEEVQGAELSPDGTRIFYTKGRGQRDFFLVPGDAAPKPDEGKLDLKKLEVKVDARAEWKQMHREAWRIMRDWFYDPNHHGQNLAQLERHYGEYLPNIVRRSDFNSLMNRMLGHVSVSHLGVGGGDQPQSGPPDRTGMLGADYEIDQNRYRFKHIYRLSNFNSPSGFVPAPLDLPGNKVKEGEYLLAVNDRNVEASKSIFSYFEGKAGQTLKLKVGPNPNGDGARTISTFAISGSDENQLRRANWSEHNRRRVEQLSGGKLGYFYVASYGVGTMDFIRGLVGYSDKPGVIIDQRFNGGGITPDYLIEWLQRRPIYYYTFREGDDIATPVNPGPQVKVLIVNENNFSAAETFAFMYKLAKVGPIVGLRTGGGGIGPYVYTPQLIDGGSVQLPNRAAYNPDGSSWGIENVGIIPDFEVEIMPQDWLMGRDPQLERAVQVALDELKKKRAASAKKPKYPVHP